MFLDISPHHLFLPQTSTAWHLTNKIFDVRTLSRVDVTCLYLMNTTSWCLPVPTRSIPRDSVSLCTSVKDSPLRSKFKTRNVYVCCLGFPIFVQASVSCPGFQILTHSTILLLFNGGVPVTRGPLTIPILTLKHRKFSTPIVPHLLLL